MILDKRNYEDELMRELKKLNDMAKEHIDESRPLTDEALIKQVRLVEMLMTQRDEPLT